MQPAEREHSLDRSHSPRPHPARVTWGTGGGRGLGPSVAARTSQLQETLAACFASELVAPVGKYFSEHLLFLYFA